MVCLLLGQHWLTRILLGLGIFWNWRRRRKIISQVFFKQIFGKMLLISFVCIEKTSTSICFIFMKMLIINLAEIKLQIVMVYGWFQHITNLLKSSLFTNMSSNANLGPHPMCLRMPDIVARPLPKNTECWGKGESPIGFFGWNPNIFVNYDPTQNFRNLWQPLQEEK